MVVVAGLCNFDADIKVNQVEITEFVSRGSVTDASTKKCLPESSSCSDIFIQIYHELSSISTLTIRT